MSTLDEYEYRRGPVRRRNRSGYGSQYGSRKPKRPTPKETQLALKLMGGTTDKDKGVPFDDPLPF